MELNIPIEDMDVTRHPKSDLLGLDVKGSPCEVCREHMHSHEWVDLDINGFAVRCSIRPTITWITEVSRRPYLW